jgi:hypothetical protein
VSNMCEALDEGLFVSKCEYFRVIYLVCRAVGAYTRSLLSST